METVARRARRAYQARRAAAEPASPEPAGRHQQTAHCENLAKLAKRKTCMRILAKLRIAKPCEALICKTLRILRNKRKTVKNVEPCALSQKAPG